MRFLSSLLFVAALMTGVQAHAATLASSTFADGSSIALVDAIGAGNVQLTNLGTRTNASNVAVGPASLSVHHAGIVSGELGSQYKRPLGVGPTDPYLSVFGGGTATFTVTSPANALSFSWGSIDSWNTLKIWTTGKGAPLVITGDTLHSMLSSLILSNNPGEYFTFTTPTSITKFVLSSETNSFEVAQMRLANVPLPAALPMFGLALLGLAGIKSRKNKA